MLPGERLRYVREILKLSQEALGEKLSFKYSKIRDIESGKQKLTLEIAMLIEEVLFVRRKWLIDEELPVFLKDGIQDTAEYKNVIKQGLTLERPDGAFDIPQPTTKIPIVSWAQAGTGGYFEDSHLQGAGFGYINRPYDVLDNSAYALIISGDSMIPKYEPGDVVIVSPELIVQTGDYAIVKLQNGEVMAKRVKEKNSHYILESINPEFCTRECKKEDIVFIHRIVWVKQRG